MRKAQAARRTLGAIAGRSLWPTAKGFSPLLMTESVIVELLPVVLIPPRADAAPPPLWESFCSRRNCPKYLADGLEVGDIPFLGAACDLVEPADRGRLQTRFGCISGGINHVDLNLDGISRATHPALTLLPPFLHLPYSTR